MTQMTGLQAMMAYWERLHPVNAVQIVEVSRPISQPALQVAADRLFQKFLAAGPGGWPTVSARGTVVSRSVSSQAVLVQSQQLSCEGCHPLETLVTTLLNHPYTNDEPPFRVGLAEQDASRYLWMSYRHCIADGRSIALLMQNLLEELEWVQPTELPLALDRTALSLSDLFPKEAREAGWLSSSWTSAQTLSALHRCHRRRTTASEDFSMTFQVHADGLPLDVIRRRARELSATIGELLVAAMLDWFLNEDRQQPRRRRSPNRCVSVIVDLARRADQKYGHLFGQFISPVNITADAQSVQSFADVVQLVRGETHERNTLVENLRRLRGLSVNSFLVRRYPRFIAIRNQDFIYRVSGTISNLNLPAILPPPRTVLPVSTYYRGTCATQFSPVIICPTTGNGKLTLTSTHRNAVYSEEEIRALGRHIVNRLVGDVGVDS